MKRFLSEFKAQRFGHDGWAIKLPSGKILDWSVCTTRDECREVAKEFANRFRFGEQGELFAMDPTPDVVKVRITVAEVPIPPHHKEYVQEQIV